jgi:hypothetical protein
MRLFLVLLFLITSAALWRVHVVSEQLRNELASCQNPLKYRRYHLTNR